MVSVFADRPKKLVLFDVDETLTLARQVIFSGGANSAI
jgi:phosphoserine phosphatase